jgi:TolB-like protein/lipopolysaccharide biosynthesis regulator YciM
VARQLRLNVLGPFEARWSDGDAVDMASRKARALLAYLAVENGRPHTRELLATLLWGDTGEERARHNLRQALSKIRQCCDGAVASRGDTVQIDTDACSIDAVDFERLAASDDAGDLQECLALYRGELLDGLTVRESDYEDWLLMARARLCRLAYQVADRLARVLVDEDRIGEAIEVLERRLTMDPACEPAHRELMDLLARVGRRSDALRQYQMCKEALERALGMEPSAETTNLFRSLKKSDAGTAPEVVPGSATPAEKTGHPLPTVAVLPFENLSGDDDAYFVNGIVEDITTSLSCFRSLLVIARGSAFRYRDRDMTDRQIADELGAQYLVRGTLQRAGQRVRINVQLLDAHAGLHLWGQRIDRELEDVFVVQDEITSTIASTLAGRVEAARLAHARRAPAERLEAYDYVLRGKDHHHRFTPEDCRTCLEMFEKAIERDPDYAVAHAWLACGIGQALVFDIDDPAKLVDRSEAACERGLEIDENEAECHRVLAQVQLTRGNLQRAMWHQERALFLNPNDDRSVCSMGEFLAYCGRHEEAEEWVRKSMQLNPFHPERYWTHLARPLFHLARDDETLQALEHISRLRRDDHVYRVAASARLGDAGRTKACVAELEKAFPELDPVNFVELMPYERDADRWALVDALETARRIT